MPHVWLQPIQGQDHMTLLLQPILDPLLIGDAQAHQFADSAAANESRLALRSPDHGPASVDASLGQSDAPENARRQ